MNKVHTVTNKITNELVTEMQNKRIHVPYVYEYLVRSHK
eukprot:gene13729-4014_t